VVAEYKKAVSLIKPGPRTAKVWVSLYGEIEKVSEWCPLYGSGLGHMVTTPQRQPNNKNNHH
jgi:hypothetical protein